MGRSLLVSLEGSPMLPRPFSWMLRDEALGGWYKVCVVLRLYSGAGGGDDDYDMLPPYYVD